MNVLHVYKDFYPVLGGIENHLRWLTAGLAARPGVRVRVLATERGRRTTRLTMDGVPVLKVGRLATVARAPIAPALFWEIGRERHDIVHLHFPYPIGELAYLVAGRAKRLVISYHSDIVRQQRLLTVYAPFLRVLLRRADALILSNPRYPETSPWLAPHRDKVRVIPFGFDLTQFALTPAVAARAAAIRAESPEPIVLFVGELRHYKGVDVLLRAMTRTPGRAIVIGGGPEEAMIRALHAELGLGDRVVFRGRASQDELIAHYHAATLFVLPSVNRAEAFGIVLQEASACGLPMVTTELGTGTSWVNRHGETGLVVPPNDPVALAEAIAALLADPDTRARYGATARQIAETEYPLERNVDRVVALYQELLAR